MCSRGIKKIWSPAVLLLLLGFFVARPLEAHAASRQFEIGAVVTLGDFVYEDDGTPSSTNSCVLSVWKPDGTTTELVDQAMTIVAASGWHYYSFTPSVATEGSWPARMTCGTALAGTLINEDMTFVVGSAVTTAAQTSIATAVWANGTRTLSAAVDLTTGATQAVWDKATSALSTVGSIGKLLVDNVNTTITSRGTATLTAADVWAVGTRRLTDKTLSGGGNLGTEDYIDTATALTAASIAALNNISATDVWAAGTRTLTGSVDLSSAATQAVWDKATSALSTGGSIGKLIVDNLNATVASRGTSTLTASDVWANATRTLSDYSDSALATAVWANGTRTLSNYGNDITAADVWNVLTANVTTVNSIGKLLTTNVDAKASDILTQAQLNGTAIAALNNISATDVWAAGTRTLTGSVDLSSAATQAVWDKATSSLSTSGSVGKLVVDNLNATVSSRGTSTLTAADVWASATRTLSDYSTSAVATAVWANATRTLSNYGNNLSAADVWNVLSSTLTTEGTIGKQLATNLDAQVSTLTAGGGGTYQVAMADFGQVLGGSTYRTKIAIVDTSNTAADAVSAPTVTIYDPLRNAAITGGVMTKLSTGVYEYTYSVATSATQGVWETVVSTTVSSGKTFTTNDYWNVAGSPAQVRIVSMGDLTVPSIAANVIITNEGSVGNEYQYEWCVVSSQNNSCGGNDDVFYSSAAKFINPGDNFTTTLPATVPSTGNYWFKLVVYFGTDSSGASSSFTAASETVTPPAGNTGSGGGGGGGSGAPAPAEAPVSQCRGADFNFDHKVNSIDLSILLYFWKKHTPFANPCVDANRDTKVDAVDFSILLYQWGGAGVSLATKP